MEPFISRGWMSFLVSAFGNGGTPIEGALEPFRLLAPTCDSLDPLPSFVEIAGSDAAPPTMGRT